MKTFDYVCFIVLAGIIYIPTSVAGILFVIAGKLRSIALWKVAARMWIACSEYITNFAENHNIELGWASVLYLKTTIATMKARLIDAELRS
jgi:hypothetical protein